VQAPAGAEEAMKPGTRRVFNALGGAANARQATLRSSVADIFQYGLVIGVQMMQVDPEFGSALIRDFLGGTPDDDADIAMYWNADQTIAALREVFEEGE
jgi:hypothetical protein